MYNTFSEFRYVHHHSDNTRWKILCISERITAGLRARSLARLQPFYKLMRYFRSLLGFFLFFSLIITNLSAITKFNIEKSLLRSFNLHTAARVEITFLFYSPYTTYPQSLYTEFTSFRSIKYSLRTEKILPAKRNNKILKPIIARKWVNSCAP